MPLFSTKRYRCFANSIVKVQYNIEKLIELHKLEGWSNVKTLNMRSKLTDDLQLGGRRILWAEDHVNRMFWLNELKKLHLLT